MYISNGHIAADQANETLHLALSFAILLAADSPPAKALFCVVVVAIRSVLQSFDLEPVEFSELKFINQHGWALPLESRIDAPWSKPGKACC